MPMVYQSPARRGKTHKVEFWIISSRGTNSSRIVNLPIDMSKEEIKSELEGWCSEFGAWQKSETSVRYGFNLKEKFGNRK